MDAEPDVVRVDLETEELVEVESKSEVVEVLTVEVLMVEVLRLEIVEADELDVGLVVCCSLLVGEEPPLVSGKNEK